MASIDDLQPHIRGLLHFMATLCGICRRDIPMCAAHMSEPVSTSGEYG